MRIKHGTGVSVTERYLSFGSNRPPSDDLESMRQELLRKHISTDRARRLLLADMHLDLAVADPARRNEHFERAVAALNSLIRDIEDLESGGYGTNFAASTDTLAVAYLRRADLDAWRQAANGNPPTPNYDTLLSSAADAISLAPYNPEAEQRAIGAIPLLIGARGLARGLGLGWSGRMALEREVNHQYSRHPRWDVGLSPDASAADFLDPPYRANVKSRRPTNGRRITPNDMYADRMGFGEAAATVWGCVLEQDGTLPNGVTEAHPTEHLDAIAANISDWINSRGDPSA